MVNIQTLVFLDLEATGLMTPLHKPKITELTMIAVHCSEFLQAHLGSTMPRILNKLTVCVNPKKVITQKACEMTGLFNDSLENQNEFDKDTVALIDVFLRRLAPPVCLLAHYGNRFDFPLLKAEINHAGSELTAEIVCADTWEMFQSLDKRTYIPVSWTRKDLILHDHVTPNGVFSRDHPDSSLPARADSQDKKHSSKPSSGAHEIVEKHNAIDVPKTLTFSHHGQDEVVQSVLRSPSEETRDCKSSDPASDSSPEHSDTPKSSRSCSPPEAKPTGITSGSPPVLGRSANQSDNSKTSDTQHGKEVTRKITSFSIKDIMPDKSDKGEVDSSHMPAIVSSGLTNLCRSVSPTNVLSKIELSSARTGDSLNRPLECSSIGTSVSCESVSNRVTGSKGDSPSRGLSAVQVSAVETKTESLKREQKIDLIRKPAKKRFCHMMESQKYDNHGLNQAEVSPKASSPDTLNIDSVKTNLAPVVSSQMSEAIGAPVSNSNPPTNSYTTPRCKTPDANLMSEACRSCPRSPTKRKPSDPDRHENEIQAKKIKKKLFDSESTSTSTTASKSDPIPDLAEPVSSSQGSSESSSNKQKLESLGTIIYWHDYFNEEFFKESLEMDDCLHPKPDSSSSREHALEKKLSPVNVPKNHISAADTTDPDPVASGSESNASNVSNPVLRSALTAPLNLSLKDHDEPDVTSSLHAPNSTKSTPTDALSSSCRPSFSGHNATTSSPSSKQPPIDVASPKSKVSYSQREIFRRAFGMYPPVSHRSEDDCLTLMQIVQQVAPKAAIWIEVNSCPFHHVDPLYTLHRK